MDAASDDFDVLVAGGGLAGVASAVAAARAGARTALVEKSFVVGGLATAGLITWYSPLCDGADTQVTFGLAEEFLHAGLRYGPGHVDGGWSDKAAREPGSGRYQSFFQPAPMVLALEEMLTDAGVTILYDTRACAPLLESGSVVGVEAENTEGRLSLRASCTVDATGDALVAHRAGAPCRAGIPQDLTMQVFEAQVPRADCDAETPDGPFIARRKLEGLVPEDALPDEAYDGTSATALTRFIVDGRRIAREHYASRQAELGADGRQRLYPILIPSMPQFRMSRCIQGRRTLHWDDHKRTIDDSVGLTANWYGKNQGEVWQIPYGVLLPEQVGGLLAPGRHASAGDRGAWDMLRIIHCCVLTGEVAGVAAAMAVAHGVSPHQLEVSLLQARLRERGMPLATEEAPRPRCTRG